MPADRIRDIYDRDAASYDAATAPLERLLLNEMRREFGATLTGRALEIAVGTGLNLPHYAETVTHAVGVDLSAGMLAVARSRSRQVRRPIDLLQMDAERLGFPDDSFDTVAISLSLCTVPHPDVALAEMLRVLRPGGRAVFLEHVRSPHPPVTALLRLLSPLQERHRGCSLIRDSVETIRQAGFRIESDRSRALGVIRLVIARSPD